MSDVRSLEDWKRRRPAVRAELLYMLGLDPFPKRTRLEARITGTLERPDYRIEKLVFQSLPGLYVTGNLYVPANGSGPRPAILYLCGHAPHPLGAKFHYQDRAAWFAAHGYVCLILDTLEFGEVAGVHHGIHDLNMWNWLSLGYTPAGVEVWNAMRAIDYPRLTEHPVSAFEYVEIERSASWVGRTVAAMQVWDILRAIEWAGGEEQISGRGISLYGKGEMGILALYAGLFDERVSQVVLNDAPASHWQGPALLNVLRITDIAEVAGAFAPRRLVSLTAFPASFDYTRKVYERRGGAHRLVRAESLAAALEVWKYSPPRGRP